MMMPELHSLNDVRSRFSKLQKDLKGLEWAFAQLDQRTCSQELLKVGRSNLESLIGRLEKVKSYIAAEELFLSEVQLGKVPTPSHITLDEVDEIRSSFVECSQSKVDVIEHLKKYRVWSEEASKGKGKFKCIMRLIKLYRVVRVIKAEAVKFSLQERQMHKQLRVLVMEVLQSSYDAADGILNQSKSAFIKMEQARREALDDTADYTEVRSRLYNDSKMVEQSRMSILELDTYASPSLESITQLTRVFQDHGLSRKSKLDERLNLINVYLASYIKRYKPWSNDSRGEVNNEF